MNVAVCNCPGCGAPLAYDAAGRKLKCGSCGNSFEPDVIDGICRENEDGVSFDLPARAFDASDALQLKASVCKACGAALLAVDSAQPAVCPYCGGTEMMPEMLDGRSKPELMVPFGVTEEQAQRLLDGYFHIRPLQRNLFRRGRKRADGLRRIYVQCWLFDCAVQGNIVYDARKKHAEGSGGSDTEHIAHYIVRRAGSMRFESIPVCGSMKPDEGIVKALGSYDVGKAVPFSASLLGNAAADNAEVNAAECEGRVIERVECAMADELRNTVSGYSLITERSRNMTVTGGKVMPVLVPIWLATAQKGGRTYTFAINGQTGKTACDAPEDKKKSLLWGGGAFAVTMGIALPVLMLMDRLHSGTATAAAIAAMIAAVTVTGALLGRLSQPDDQELTAGYAGKSAFSLETRYDKYLYEKTTRREAGNSDKNAAEV